ncbi:MAG TPA: hypothetical protein VEH57_00945 [Thermoplasmata archaeon]|nr:hypothetical protein [Thermoplasmata archaeon]
MSAIFQRPLCDMGRAYDFAFRPVIGDADLGSGGPCDDRPHPVDLWAARADPRSPSAEWQRFSLCPEHETQLRHHERRLGEAGVSSRFRSAVAGPGGR